MDRQRSCPANRLTTRRSCKCCSGRTNSFQPVRSHRIPILRDVDTNVYLLVMPQSPLSALSPSTPPGSPPLIDLSPPSEKTTKLSAGSFVWGDTKVKDKKSSYGRREGHSILAGEEAPGFRRCAQAVDVSSQTLSESLI